MTYDPVPVEIPLFLRRQESHEDRRVPTLGNLRRVPSMSELSDDYAGTPSFCQIYVPVICYPLSIAQGDCPGSFGGFAG